MDSQQAAKASTVLDRRSAGAVMHITSLPGKYGIGELGREALNFVDELVRMRLHVWQVLPLGPTAYGDSPYQSLSTVAGNEMLIDIENLIELKLLQADDVKPLASLPEDRVDFDRLIPAKRIVLGTAASRFLDNAEAELKREFDEFVERHDADWLHDYALFRVLKNQHEQQSWQDWQRDFAERDDDTLRRVTRTDSVALAKVKVLQFLFFRQWASLRDYAQQNGVVLLGDIPIYIAMDSADAWANRSILSTDKDGKPDGVAGVPPDYFSNDGQLWGNPLYDWPQHEADGYSWWIERLRATLQFVDLVRIDHFRGFESYWVVPPDATNARKGHWAPGPGDKIFDAMRAAMGSLPIVAEDLGDITPQVEQLRDRQKLCGMRVLQFEIGNEDFSLSDIGSNTVCYTGTHDNDTTVGWFHGSPDDLRSAEEIKQHQQAALRVTGGTEKTVHMDMIATAFSSKAMLAIAPMQDYLGLGSEARMNTPGVAGGNWRWRMTRSQLTPQICDNVASVVNASNRNLGT